jgi:hypothetical protein
MITPATASLQTLRGPCHTALAASPLQHPVCSPRATLTPPPSRPPQQLTSAPPPAPCCMHLVSTRSPLVFHWKPPSHGGMRREARLQKAAATKAGKRRPCHAPRGMRAFRSPRLTMIPQQLQTWCSHLLMCLSLHASSLVRSQCRRLQWHEFKHGRDRAARAWGWRVACRILRIHTLVPIEAWPSLALTLLM